MEVKITCIYCDHTIYKTFYDQRSMQDLRCEKCGDLNLTMKDVAKDKIDTYAGAPPFETKENFENESEKDSSFRWGNGGD